jgi:hypothetical protein
MTYYLAIDNRAYYHPPMRFLELVWGRVSKPLTLREARNYAITIMKKHPEIWCITILKRTKKDTYTGIERVFPDGITEVEDVDKGWDYVTDYDMKPHRCYIDDFNAVYKVIEVI